MEKTIFFIIAYIFEGFILWHYCSCLFTSVYARKTECICLAFSYTILFIISFAGVPWANTFSFTLLNFILILVLYKEAWYSSLFHSLAITIAMNLSELIIISLGNLSPAFFPKQLYIKNMVILTISSKLLYFFVVSVIIRIFKNVKKNNIKPDRKVFLFNAVPVISIFIVIAIISVYLAIPLPQIPGYIVSAGTILLLVLNLLVFYIYNYIQNKNYEFTQLQLQIQKENAYTEYYNMLLKHDEDQKILIHDIKKHLMSISELNKKGEHEKIDTYISHIINSPALCPSVQICGNNLLNSILCRYSSICYDKSISLHTDIRNGLLEFMEYDDLTALFCNLLDNAQEAAEGIPETFISISVTYKENTKLTIISLVNSCAVNPFPEKTGLLASAKKNNPFHGYGLKSINRIVKKYNGEMNLYYNEDDNTFHTVIYLKY